MYYKNVFSSSTLSTLVVAAFMMTAATVVSSCKKDKDNDPPASFTVSFDPDGGTPKPADQTVAQGGKATVPSPEPTKAEFAFGGWYNGADEWDFDTPITADLNLKANWTPQQPDAPTVTLTPASVTVSNTTLTQTVTVGGTATGTVTLNTTDLPAQVTATASGETITVTGVRPTTNVPPIEDTFTVGVTREGVTQNLTVVVNLTTTWTDPWAGFAPGLYLGAPESLTASSERITTVTPNNVTDAVTHVKANAGAYTLVISENVTVSAEQNLDVGNVQLTIIGTPGAERQISRTANGRTFRLGSSGRTGIELTIGANITLQGRTGNTTDVVTVLNGATFTMLDGSKITGNTSSATADGFGRGAAVSVSGSTFTMKGGTIIGNNATATASNISPGGLYAYGANTTVILEGGVIEGNSGGAGDVYLANTINAATLSGNAKIGTLTMNASTSTNRAALTIGAGWDGTVATLNLRSGNTNMETVRGFWANGEPILLGTVNATTVGQITLGNFLSGAATGNTEAISPAYYLNASGVLVGTPPTP